MKTNKDILKTCSCLLFGAAMLSCSGNNGKYDATGTFDATEITVSSEAAGAILELDITEGDKLAKGQQVGLIDSLQLHLQKQQLLQNIEALEANRPDAGTQLAPLEEQLAKQRQEKKRVENLLKAEAATSKQLDDINSAMLILEKQIAAQRNALDKAAVAADAQIAALQTQVAQLDDRLSKCRITAPADGTVLAKYAQAGELASAGRPLMKIADMEHVFLKAYVISAQLAGIKLGQAVKVRADFGGETYREYDGTITWISDKSEFTPKNITTSDERANMVYAIKVSVANDGYLKLGMYGEVKF